MRMYHFALFFMCVGAVAGMLNYIMVDAGGDNWFNVQPSNMSTVSITEEDITRIQPPDDSSSLDLIEDTGKYFALLWSVLGGILNITSMLDDFLYWDVNGVNVFAPILLLFQGMIYLIYAVGLIQFVMNRQIKGMD